MTIPPKYTFTDLQAAIQNLNANEGAPVSWCPLPWTHVSVKGNGTYRVCCHAGTSESRGTIRNPDGKAMHISSRSWEEAINSDIMKKVRKDMLSGVWSPVCVRCQREHAAGMRPRNETERYLLAELVAPDSYPNFQKAQALTAEDGTINTQDFPVSFLDIRFGNLCNLKCVMCSPTDSDQWYEDYQAIWGKDMFHDSDGPVKLVRNERGRLTTAENVFDWSDDPNLRAEIMSRIHALRRIYIVGGEPLLINAHYDFLQQCINEGIAGDVVIEYNSNITNIPQRAWDIWTKFKKISIGVSIDGIGEVNDLIRFPSKWWKIEENLKRLDSTTEAHFELHITAAISILNLWNLPLFLDYLLKANFKRVNPWDRKPLMSPHPVHRPNYLHVSILGDDAKADVERVFNEWKTKWRSQDFEAEIGPSEICDWKTKVEYACHLLDRYIEIMRTVSYTEQELSNWRRHTMHFLDTLDIRRKTDWRSVCPELARYTGDWKGL